MSAASICRKSRDRAPPNAGVDRLSHNLERSARVVLLFGAFMDISEQRLLLALEKMAEAGEFTIQTAFL
jgi:hypothetical protein